MYVNPRVQFIFRKVLPWAIIVIVGGAIFYLVKFMPIAVPIQRAAIGEVVAEVMGTGTLEARYQTTISAKISGRIVELLADQNDKVKEDQLLARLDDAELRQEVSIAEATLHAARATVERAKADEIRSKAVMEQAQRDHERYTSLVAAKTISQETLEKTRERLQVAEAEVAKAAAATAEALRQVTTAEERLRYSEARLADTRIVSPFEGLVVRRDRETGDVVVPGASIFQLVSLKEMWIAAWVDESAMAGLGVGQPARIVFRSQPDKSYTGKVARLAREVDRETREFRVDIQVSELPANWAVGQRAETFIETGRKSETLNVPLSSIVWRNGSPGVNTIQGGKALWKKVTIGLRGIDRVEITGGISKDEVYVAGPEASQLTNGQRVKPR
ncbi:MAG: efflux RND transporter periplasmic adaptor subunit [Desulfomonile sp.]|nr:efflux RND transporter periplasmic adaptor subunit [Desulfomonile sp.]